MRRHLQSLNRPRWHQPLVVGEGRTLSTDTPRHQSQLEATPNLGHFLKNREGFLSSIGAKERRMLAQRSQHKLIDMLEGVGSRMAVNPVAGLGCGPFATTGQQPAFSPRDAVTIRQMMACGMHLGHATARWNAKMAPFIFGERAGIHIINLEKSLVCLRQACSVVTDIASKGGSIVFVGTGDSIQRLVYECAQECGQFYVNTRWIGGAISNRAQVLRNDQLTPDLLLILDPIRNGKAIEEAYNDGIPTIAICDSNVDPSKVTYPIPANDDAYSSIELVARTLSRAAAEGRRVRTRPPKSTEILESATSFMERVFTGKS